MAKPITAEDFNRLMEERKRIIGASIHKDGVSINDFINILKYSVSYLNNLKKRGFITKETLVKNSGISVACYELANREYIAFMSKKKNKGNGLPPFTVEQLAKIPLSVIENAKGIKSKPYHLKCLKHTVKFVGLKFAE